VLDERLGDGNDLVPVGLDQSLGVAIGLIDDPFDLFVNDPGGLVGVILLRHE
jgi:hypothetical protein